MRSRLRPSAFDVALAGIFLVVGLFEVWTMAPVDRVAGTAVVLGMTVPLAWRQRCPLATALAVLGTVLVSALVVVPIDGFIFFIPVLVIALYSLGAHTEWSRALLGLAATLGIMWATLFVEGGPGLQNLVFGLVVACAPWGAGRLVRRRTGQGAALARRAQELEASQAEREQAAVAAERARIARELHDVIAHSVSVMTIQAGAIESTVEEGRARSAAGVIRRTGQQAQTDLRHLLGLLHGGASGGNGLAPQPGLARLDELIDTVRRTGLDVRLDVDGTPQTLPAAVDLSAFRIVQEALTNTLKHAGASTATVAVRYRPEAVDIEVVDDGTNGATDGQPSSGQGLVGMRERIALFGGQLQYGRLAEGGFRVRAVLPREGAAG